MSDSSVILDTNEAEDQLNLGLKMIVSAFENQTRSLSAEITRLNNELAAVSSSKSELELRCSSQSQDKKDLESQVNELSNQNILLTQSIKELSLENAKLKNIKSSIIATIEKTDPSIPKTTAHEGFSPTHIKTNIKFCKPMTSFTRNNKHLSVDNYSQEFNLGSNQSHCKLRTPLSISKQSTTRTSSKKVPISSNPEVSKCNTPFGSSDNILANCKGNNNNFFQNCRKVMSQQDYNALIEIVRAFNMKTLSKQETFFNITQILEERYAELLEEFKKLFFANE